MTIGGGIGAIIGGTIGFFIGGPMGAAIGAGIGAGLGMWIDPLDPDMPSPGQADTGELSLTTAEEGAVVFDLLGTTKITGNLLWYGKERVVEQTEEVDTGKDTEDVVTGYKYYMSWAIGLCLGPIDEVLTIFADDTVVWQGHLEKPASGGEETITLGVIDEESSMGTMTMYFGTADQVANSVMTTELGADLNPAYRHFCYAFFNDCYLGTYNRQPTMKFVIRKTPSFGFSANNRIGSYNYNAAHALWYVLTDMVGLPDSYLNTTDFASMASTLNTEGVGISIFFSTQNTALTYIESILSHVFGILRYGNDGEFHPKLLRDDIGVGSLPVVTEDSMLADLQLNRPSWLDTINELKVKYARITGEIIGGQDEGLIGPGDQYSDPWRGLMKDSSGNLHLVYRCTDPDARVNHAISTDMGQTWTVSTIDNVVSADGNVSAAIDSEDVITAVWYDGVASQANRLRYAQYNGSWGSAYIIPVSGQNPNSQSYAFASSTTPHVIIDNSDNVYVIFEGHTGLSYGSEGCITRKLKQGSTWSDWQRIGDGLSGSQESVFDDACDLSATFDAEGSYLHIVGLKASEGFANRKILYAKGTISNWLIAQELADYQNDQGYAQQACPYVIIDYQNVPNIFWWDFDGYVRHVRGTGSLGVWGSIDDLSGPQSDYPCVCPSVSHDRLEIHIIYQKDSGDIYHRRRYYSQSPSEMFGSWIWDSEELLKDYASVSDICSLYAQFPGNQNPDEGYAFVYRDPDGDIRFYSDVLWEIEGGIDFEEAALIIVDPANQSVVGRVSHKSIQLPLYTSETEASWAADRMLKSLAYPLAPISFPANRDLFRYEPGDLFILNYAPYSITGMVCRVTSISEDSPESEVIGVNALEDVDYLASEMSWTAPTGLGTASSWLCEDIDVLAFLEPPYDAVGDKLAVGALTARQVNKQIGAIAYISVDALSYRQLGKIGVLTPYGTLDANYTVDTHKIDDTTGFQVTFDSLSNLDEIRTLSRTELFYHYNLCMLGDEIMAFQTFTFVSGTTYTCTGVVRGLFDTEQVAHTAGEDFWFIGERYFNTFEHSHLKPNLEFYFKGIMYNSRKSGILSQAERHELTIEGRARKPYKPSNLKANLIGNYASYSESILLEWCPRVRGDGAGINDADTTTDSAPTWEGLFQIEVYVSSNLVRTITGIDACYFEYTSEMNQEDNGTTYPASIEFRLKNYIYVDSNYFYSDYESVTVTYDINAPSYVTLPVGNRWEVVVDDDSGSLYSLAVFNSRLYAGGYGALLYEFDDIDRWVQVSTSKTYPITDYPEINKNPAITNMVELNSKLYCSTKHYGGLYEWNGTDELTMVSDELDTLVHKSDAVYIDALAVHNSKIYAGYWFADYPLVNTYRFLEWNGVDAWVQKTTPPGRFSGLCVLSGKLYAVFMSDLSLREWNEGGNTWDQKAYVTGESACYSIVVHNSKIYASSNGKLYEWDGASSWVEVADKYSDDTPYIWRMLSFDGYLLAVTGNSGIMLKWNGIDAWESVAEHPGGAVELTMMTSLKGLIDLNGKVYAAGHAGQYLLRWGGA